VRKACGGEEVKGRGVGGAWREGLVVGVEVAVGLGVEVEVEVEVGIGGEVGWVVVLGWEGKGVVVMLRAEAVAEGVDVEEGVEEEAGLA